MKIWVYGKCEFWYKGIFSKGILIFYMETLFLRNSIDFLNVVHSRGLKLYGAIDFFIEKHILRICKGLIFGNVPPFKVFHDRNSSKCVALKKAVLL